MRPIFVQTRSSTIAAKMIKRVRLRVERTANLEYASHRVSEKTSPIGHEGTCYGTVQNSLNLFKHKNKTDPHSILRLNKTSVSLCERSMFETQVKVRRGKGGMKPALPSGVAYRSPYAPSNQILWSCAPSSPGVGHVRQGLRGCFDLGRTGYKRNTLFARNGISPRQITSSRRPECLSLAFQPHEGCIPVRWTIYLELESDSCFPCSGVLKGSTSETCSNIWQARYKADRASDQKRFFFPLARSGVYSPRSRWVCRAASHNFLVCWRYYSSNWFFLVGTGYNKEL